jgi:hypothetical protein
MLGMLAWMVEQACRFADAQVCAIGNLGDEVELAE